MIYIFGNIGDDINQFYRTVSANEIGEKDCMIVGGQMRLNSVKEKSILEICAVNTLFIDMEKEKKTEEFNTREFLGGQVVYEKAFPDLLYPIKGEVYKII